MVDPVACGALHRPSAIFATVFYTMVLNSRKKPFKESVDILAIIYENDVPSYPSYVSNVCRLVCGRVVHSR